MLRKQRKRAAADGAGPVLLEGTAEEELLAEMALEEAEFHDQLHDLPFGGDVEIERWVYCDWIGFGCLEDVPLGCFKSCATDLN